MSKTNNMCHKDIRWQLLATVSAAALLASAYGVDAADSARPLLWIELGGQLDQLSDSQDAFKPAFLNSITQANLLSALDVQHSSKFALDPQAKITFQPEDSDWVFSASVRYGRSQAKHSKHQQTPNALVPVAGHMHFPPPLATKYPTKYIVKTGYSFYPNGRVKFAGGESEQSERHAIVDFQAGKDVGLGMFGGRGSSVLSAGIRIAQFSSKAHVDMHADPDVQYPTSPISTFFQLRQFKYYDSIRLHDYAAMSDSKRSFRGIGPSLSWNASAPVAGNSESGEITIDWGINGAVLFGRQKASGHHQTKTQEYYGLGCKKGFPDQNNLTGVRGCLFIPAVQESGHPYHTSSSSGGFDRSRSVTVPNLGGFAGLSFRYADAKISLGYRADLFFNAIDGGIDARKNENRAFFGPYASISIGLGD
jgi:iron complex outermembrane recepter protein